MNISFIYSYSSLLFEIGTKEKKIKTYYKQACFLVDVLTKTELADFLSNLSIDKQQRKKVFKSMFQKKLETKFIYFVWTIIDFNRGDYLEKILRSFLSIYDDYFSINFVKVYSAFALNPKHLNDIKKALTQKYKKQIVLENIVDPSVIGGIKIESKYMSIDNTFKKKLEIIKQKSIAPIQQRS